MIKSLSTSIKTQQANQRIRTKQTFIISVSNPSVSILLRHHCFETGDQTQKTHVLRGFVTPIDSIRYEMLLCESCLNLFSICFFFFCCCCFFRCFFFSTHPIDPSTPCWCVQCASVSTDTSRQLDSEEAVCRCLARFAARTGHTDTG